MATIGDIKDKVKSILTLVESWAKGKVPDIPAQKLEQLVNEFDRLLVDMKKIGPPSPTKEDSALALKHALGSQIVNFTTFDAKRKRFFCPAYFEGKFSSLPKDRQVYLAATGKKTAFREALILYHWWNSRNDGFRGLDEFWGQIQSDYRNSPEVRKVAEAQAIVDELMGLSDVSETAARLLKAFPTDAALKEFAKLVSLKIPAQAKGKGAPRLTAHQRLAKEIHSQGGVSRLELD